MSNTRQSSTQYSTRNSLGRNEKWKEKYDGTLQPRQPWTQRQRRKPAPSLSTQIPVDMLAPFKSAPIVLPEDFRVARPLMGRCCDCMTTSKKDLYTDGLQDQGFRNILNVKKELRKLGPLGRRMYHIAYVLRRRSHNIYPDVSLSVLMSQRVIDAVELKTTEISRNSGKAVEKCRRKCEKKAKSLVTRMKASISDSFIKLTTWFLFKFLGHLLRSVQVHKGQMEMVKRAHQRKLPMIYLPLHRSHLDYILTTWILVNYDIRAPHVAAGENLNMPVFNRLMRWLGGYFIRRKLDRENGRKDITYRAVLTSYMQELLKNGESMEFFLEGRRSRTGRSCIPKAGLLSVVVDSCMEGVIEDVFIVPMSISYERPIEGSFSDEMMGNLKVSESFIGTVKELWRVWNDYYGSVRVDFAQPFSLKEFIQVTKSQLSPTSMIESFSPVSSEESLSLSYLSASHLLKRNSNSSLLGGEANDQEKRCVIKKLADHVIFDATRTTALMCTHLVAFLLLTKFRQGVTRKKFLHDLQWLKDEAVYRKRDVGFCGSNENVFEYACVFIGPGLIHRCFNQELDTDVFTPNLSLPAVFELSYCASPVISLFLMESVLANAVVSIGQVKLSMISSAYDNLGEKGILRDDIIEVALEICKLLQCEFIFVPPCKDLTDVVTDHLDEFILTEILREKDVEMNPDTQWSKRVARYALDEDESDDEYFEPQKLWINTQRDDCMEKLQFFQNILAPILESYLTTAQFIKQDLITETPADDFLCSLHKFAIEKAEQNAMMFNESAAYEVLKNAVKSFEELKIVDSYYAGNLRMIELNGHFDVRERLGHFIELLETVGE